MRMAFERFWYRPSLTFLTVCLLPLSWLFRLVIGSRRFIYQTKLKKSFRFPVPVVIVGNITVGGTGKTPFVIWLANELRSQGYIPGIVTRGVGGHKQRNPYWVTEKSNTREVGDEAVLLAKRTQCPVVISINRVAAVKDLLAKTPCNVVISDDGLQHYRLKRDIEIAIIDGMRGLGNKRLLPAGPLREPISRLNEVDYIVRQGDANFGEFSMKLEGTQLVSVKDASRVISLDQFKNRRVHAVAAIGNPSRFFAMLREKGLDVIEHKFLDHYLFTPEDLIFPDEFPVVMTEKDAVKCHDFADDKCWYISVDATIDRVLLNSMLKRLL